MSSWIHHKCLRNHILQLHWTWDPFLGSGHSTAVNSCWHCCSVSAQFVKVLKCQVLYWSCFHHVHLIQWWVCWGWAFWFVSVQSIATCNRNFVSQEAAAEESAIHSCLPRDKLLCFLQRKSEKLEAVLHLHLIITCLQVSALFLVVIFQEEISTFCTNSLPNSDAAPVALQKFLPIGHLPSFGLISAVFSLSLPLIRKLDENWDKITDKKWRM